MPLEYLNQPTTSYNLASPYFTPSQPQQEGSGSSGLSNFPVSSFKNFGSGGSSGITSTLNSFGTKLGFSPGGFSYTQAGALPWQTAGGVANPALAGTSGVAPATGSLGSTATLSSTLGAAGLGAFAGNFLGKIGGNQTGGSIGGGVGAAVGNLVLPGVGGVIGGLIGGIGGGMFGSKKPSNKTQVGVLKSDGTIDVAGGKALSLSGKKFDANNAQIRDAVAGGASNFTKYLISQGATPKNSENQFIFGVANRDGLSVGTRGIDGKITYSTITKDYKELSNGAYNTIIQNYNIPYSLQGQLQEINKDDIASYGNTSASSTGNGGTNAGGANYSLRATPYGIGPRGTTNKKTFQQFYTDYKAGKK